MTTCNEIKYELPEYIDGKLDKETAEMVKNHLEICESCRNIHTELKSFITFTGSFPEIEPPKGMKEEFLEMVEMENKPSGKLIRIPVWVKVAASVLIVFGTFSTGYITGSKNNKISSLQTEINSLKQEVLLAGLRDYSGPQKIEAVYNIKTSGRDDENLVDALVYTMNSDKNVNVRLAAINALSEMMGKNMRIKTELIKSLQVQENPLLQISLIQVLTESGVKEAKEEIESISNNENTDIQVREYAKNMIKTII
jgi:hypothetical protein